MNKAFVFDFDDTLATTECRIAVRWKIDESVGRWLTPAEYNSHELDSSMYYDYSEFGEVIEPQVNYVFHLYKEVHAENHDCYILTARNSAAADAINCWLKENGVSAKEIICVGDSDEAIQHAKAKWLKRIMDLYDRVYFYDDCPKNVSSARELGLKANLV